jgi:lysophospholipase L1-like esterase
MAIFGGSIKPYTPCPVGGTLLINPMGDSITDGLPTAGGWRSLLLAMIADKRAGTVGPSGAVDSLGGKDSAAYGFDAALCGTSASGFGGSSAAQWQTQNYLVTYNPGTVHFGLLMLGANDVGDNADTAELYIGPLIDQFLDLHPLAVIFVASRTPRATTSGSVYAAAVKNEVDVRRAKGKNAVYVDQYSAVSLAYSYDGLHYGMDGNVRLAERWYSAIQPFLR